jgi:hypothetical protein
MVLQQARGCRRGDHINWPEALSKHRQQWRGEDHVAQEGGLDDEDGRTVRRYGGMFHPLIPNLSRATAVPPFRRTAGH